MKEWPDDNEVVPFSELIAPVKEALLAAYKMRRQREGKDIPYDGYNFGWRDLTTLPPPDQYLSAESIKYGEENQSRDVLDVILNIAFVLGMEQGRRLVISDPLLTMHIRDAILGRDRAYITGFFERNGMLHKRDLEELSRIPRDK